MGLVIDFGWSYWRKEAAATAATSAASAAIAAVTAGSSCGTDTSHWNCSSSYSCAANPTTPPANNLDNGCLYAKQNGFVNTGRQTVTMLGGTGAPPTAPGLSPSYYVIAKVSENVPTLFSAVLGESWMHIASESTAAIFPSSAGACIYVVSTNADKALNMTSGAFISGCGIDVDSNKSGALNATGGSMGLSGGAGISVVGQSTNGAQYISFTGGGSLKTGQAAHGDPFALNVTAPTPAGTCTPDPNYQSGMNNITIPSGTYCSLTLSGGTGLVLSGTYIITQGSFKITAGSASTAAGGALIYIAPTSTGSFDLTGYSGTLTLNGLTSATNNGFAVWEANAVSAKITNTSVLINGVIYAPNSLLTYTAGTTTQSQTILANTLNLTGGSLAHPAASSLYSSGYSPGGSFIVN